MPTNGSGGNGQLPGAAKQNAKSVSKPIRDYDTADDALAELEQKLGKASQAGDMTMLGASRSATFTDGTRTKARTSAPSAETQTDDGSSAACPSLARCTALSEVLNAPTSSRVYVCEGEKAADAARALGLVATTSAHGSKSAAKTDWSPLAGHEVVIVPDADDAGERYADDVAGLLAKLDPAQVVKVVHLPDLPVGEGGDMADFVALRGGDATRIRAEVEALADRAEAVQPASDWPDLEPLDDPVLPAFPTASLPPVIRDWVEAEAEATQTPADLPGMLSSAIIAALIAKRVGIEAWPGWKEPTNLFVAVLMDPGNRKSAVFDDATDPLRKLEADLIAEVRTDVARQCAERDTDNKRLEKLKKRAAENDDADARTQASDLAAKLESEPEPVLPRLLCDNVTPEQLEILLAQHGGRIANMSPEGGIFDIMAGRYSDGGASFDAWLKGHAGDDMRTDRVGRESVRIDKPALTCGYAIQPEVVRGLLKHRSMRGRGLLGRFLYAMPKSILGQRRIQPLPMPAEIAEAFHQRVQELGHLEGEHLLCLTHDAQQNFKHWCKSIEARLKPDGDLGHMNDWSGKLCGAALRLAGVLHMAERGTRGVGEAVQQPTIEAAITIAEYLIPHADAVLRMMDAAGTTASHALHVLHWIRRQGATRFTERALWQSVRRRFKDRTQLDEALNELSTRGYIRRVESNATSKGRKSLAWEVNPAMVGETESRTQNPQNSTPGAESDTFVDFVYASEQAARDTAPPEGVEPLTRSTLGGQGAATPAEPGIASSPQSQDSPPIPHRQADSGRSTP